MKNYICVPHSNNLLVLNNDDFSAIDCQCSNSLNIDYAWIIEEDGILNWNKKKYDVKKGDVVVLLYKYTPEKDMDYNDREIAIFHNDTIYNNFLNEKEYHKRRKNKITESDCCECVPGRG